MPDSKARAWKQGLRLRVLDSALGEAPAISLGRGRGKRADSVAKGLSGRCRRTLVFTTTRGTSGGGQKGPPWIHGKA